MQVSNANNVNIYNLSAGKSLPEWISDRRRRKLQQDDIDVRRRIELIQDFEMPGVSDRVKMSKDGNFILATGSYKPRVRCYDVKQFSMKFERCFDADVINFEILSDDYSKIIFLHCDRYIEFHAQYGKYFRIRIPKFGRDLAYDLPTCDLFVVGAGSEICRLNLEQGQFLAPYVTKSCDLNVCRINPTHHLLVCGSTDGKIEAWDPRTGKAIATLDCALDTGSINTLASVTALNFIDGLTMAVGTSEGQVMLYDLRSNKPFLVKDHQYGLPVNTVEFVPGADLVVSMDSKVVRMWARTSGKALAAIEPGPALNHLCLVPRSGMMFIANENKKILTYYVPAIGPAPSWCSHLDSLTEELEEDKADVVYDDYKFVTKKELDQLGLAQLIGTNLLRAYMHGYFLDARLYRKAKSADTTFNYAKYRQERIREKLDSERTSRVKVNKLPAINRKLAEKLAAEQTNKTDASAILSDDRWASLFTDPDFEVDETSEEYRLLNPLIKHNERKQLKKMAEAEAEAEGEAYSSSDDEDRVWVEETKREHRLVKHENREKRRQEDADARLVPSFYSLGPGEEFRVGASTARTASEDIARQSLGERLSRDEQTQPATTTGHTALCHREVSFKIQKKTKKQPEPHVRHIRSARGLGRKLQLNRGRYRK